MYKRDLHGDTENSCTVQYSRKKYDWFLEFPTEDIFVEVVKIAFKDRIDGYT